MSGFSFTVLGHRVWVRKCKNPSEIGGIAIPEKSQEFTTACEVVAVGPNVGERRNMKNVRDDIRESVCAHQSSPIKVGGVVWVDNSHPLTTRLPWSDHEYLVDECAITAMEI